MWYFLFLCAVAAMVVVAYFKNSRLFYAAVAAVAVVGTIGLSVMVVQPGTVGFMKTFGNLSYATYDQGLHFVNPFADGIRGNIRRQSLNYTGDSTAVGLTKNKVALFVDVTVPYILNPQAAPLLYERYGKSWNLIGPSSRKAIRDCTSRLDWEEAVGEKGREAMTVCIPERMQVAVVADLMSAGFTQYEAANAFTFPDALIRRMVPKQERILAAIAEEQAAVVDLRRQETLTAIAEEEAKRRANEGSGIRMMMAELPDNFTVTEMVSMINANAAKANAEAFTKAVENGNPNITVIVGSGGDIPVTVPASGS